MGLETNPNYELERTTVQTRCSSSVRHEFFYKVRYLVRNTLEF